MDIQKERQAFEKVIEDMGLSATKVCANEVYTTQKVRDMWAGWQTAKAQSVPEGYVVVECQKILDLQSKYRVALENQIIANEAIDSLDIELNKMPTNSGITITGHDLQLVSNFMAYDEPENLDHEVTIELCGTGFDGAGLYAWCAEYPEEGGIKLGQAQEPSQ